MELFTDESQDFNCDIQLDGASLNEARARLVLEFNDKSLLLKGTINKNGQCNIPIPALKEYESAEGNAVLEVIAEQTIFEPWNDSFVVKPSKSIKVENANVGLKRNSKSKKNVSVNVKSTLNESDTTLIKEQANKIKKYPKDKQLKLAKKLSKIKISEDSKNAVKKILGNDADVIPSTYAAYKLDKNKK